MRQLRDYRGFHLFRRQGDTFKAETRHRLTCQRPQEGFAPLLRRQRLLPAHHGAQPQGKPCQRRLLGEIRPVRRLPDVGLASNIHANRIKCSRFLRGIAPEFPSFLTETVV